MTLTAALPLLLMLIGALVYGLSSNPKVAELGRLTFAAGVFALAFVWAGHTFHLP